MPNPNDDFYCFRSNDMELLKTGQFSGAQIIVGDRVWKVHKSIVCLRSDFLSKELSSPSNPGGVKSVTIQSNTEEEVALLLEFIYCGSITAIDNLKPHDCVQLFMLGEYFQVSGMVSYATKALWLKLTSYLQTNWTIPADFGFRRMNLFDIVETRKLIFDLEFTNAVKTAYKGPGTTCQLVLADFVWIARGWLLRDPVIEPLNTRFPLFGSHVLTTLTKGPQSSYVQADGQIMLAANKPSSPLGTTCSRAQVEARGQAKQHCLSRRL